MRRIIPTALLTSLVATLVVSAANAPKPGRDWPQFRGIAANGIAEGFSVPATWSVAEKTNIAWTTDIPGLGLLSITSPDLLHRGWTAAQAARWSGRRDPSHIEQLLSQLAPGAGLVTLCDAAPASLSWLGGVLGQRVAPLGVERFGQTGSLPDLYAAYRLDSAAITEAAAEILLG